MKPIVRALFLLFCWSVFSGWGFLVHRTIHQLAIYRLPSPLQAFFFHYKEDLVRHSVRPDQRRFKDNQEAPRHFIDLEAYGEGAANSMPQSWEAAIGKYGRDSLLRWGYVPYQVMHTQADLVRAFKNRDADSIIFFAADLGHYISDAHVPLHTTLNYDGQLTNQKGLHALWETVVPELLLTSFRLQEPGVARYLKDPEQAIWEAVRSGNRLLDEVFSTEVELTRSFREETKYRVQIRKGKEVKLYSTAFARAYGEQVQPAVNEQLLRSVRLVADFWYTAWVEAGKPELGSLLPLTDRDKEGKQIQQELKAYRNNQLISTKWLIATQKKEDED